MTATTCVGRCRPPPQRAELKEWNSLIAALERDALDAAKARTDARTPALLGATLGLKDAMRELPAVLASAISDPTKSPPTTGQESKGIDQIEPTSDLESGGSGQTDNHDDSDELADKSHAGEPNDETIRYTPGDVNGEGSEQLPAGEGPDKENQTGEAAVGRDADAAETETVVPKNKGGRPTEWDDLWKVCQDLEAKGTADDPKIVATYHQRYPNERKATTETLQQIRYERTKRKRK